MTLKERLAEAIGHQRAGRLDEAQALYEAVLAETPGQADALQLLAHLALARGDTGAALARLDQALAAAPKRASLYNDYGAALRLAGRAREAPAWFDRAVALKSDYLEAWSNLGLTQRALGNWREAATALRRAIAGGLDLPEAHNGLGTVLAAQGDAAGARAAFESAIKLRPDYAEAWSNLGLAHFNLDARAEAKAALTQALALDPKLADAVFNLGIVHQDEGDFAAARECWRRVLDLAPDHQTARGNLLQSLQYDPEASPALQLEEAKEWGRRHGAVAQRFTAWPNRPEPERKLRIGYVSGDFRDHSCAHFLGPLLAAHNRSQVEVYAYAEVRRPDDTTRRLKTLLDHWLDTTGLEDGVVADRVRADGIDILVDLAGHTANNRLGVFALKPAPIQASWLGYPGTTGLDAIDYRLTDAIADPPGAEDQATETLIRLEDGFHCYAAPPGAPAVALPPFRARSYVTFGSFNNIQKLTAPTAAVWAEILSRVPGARLALKSIRLNEPPVQERVRGWFAAAGIGPERLDLGGWIDDAGGHLAAYAGIDIGLDPFPYNGTTTTLEALWMGVPVVVLRGDHHAARVGASLLTHARAPELVQDSIDAYIAAAVALAAAPERLTVYREGLRLRLAGSPLMDAPGFARRIETAYRSMWRRWCTATAR